MMLKIAVRAFILMFLEKSYKMQPLWDVVAQEIADKKITTFEQLLSRVEESLAAEFLDALTQLELELTRMKHAKEPLQEIAHILKGNKDRFIACLHALEPMSLDEDAVVQLKIDSTKRLSKEQIEVIKKVLHSKEFDELFDHLTDLLKHNRFLITLERLQRGEQISFASPLMWGLCV